jgi:hypothetical protein
MVSTVLGPIDGLDDLIWRTIPSPYGQARASSPIRSCWGAVQVDIQRTKWQRAALLRLLATSRLPLTQRRALYENAELPVRWDLTHCAASRTLGRLPCAQPFFQRTPLLGRTHDLRADLRRPPAQLTMHDA